MPSLPRLVSAGGPWLREEGGPLVVLRGVNMVPKTCKSPEELGFDARHARLLVERGFNVVRLGMLWSNVEPFQGDYDTDYIASIARTIEMLGEHGIYSLVDFHQDAYAAPFGDGAPVWAVVPAGTNSPDLGFPANLFAGGATGIEVRTDIDKAFDAFWASERVLGMGLQEHYAAMAQTVAGALRPQGGNILGYDMINEPFPGSSWDESLVDIAKQDFSEGCKTFDQERLSDFYRRIIRAIRLGDPEAMAWYEPNMMHGFNCPTFVDALDEEFDNLGFTFHDYDAGRGYTAPVENALAHADGRDLPLLVGEFGATTKTDEILACDAVLERNMLSPVYWSWFNNPIYKFFSNQQLPDDPRKQAVVLNPAKDLDDPDNVNFDMLDALTRPHPARVAGTPTGWSFDRDVGEFEMGYSVLLPDGGTVDAATEIVIPQALAPKGYEATVTNGEVTSDANAPVLRVVENSGVESVSVSVRLCG